MSYTKAQYRIRTGQRMDAATTGSGSTWSTSAGSQRWDTTANGEVDNVISAAFDQEWRRILQANANYRIASWSPVSSATTGRYALSDIQTTAGDSQKRLYRIVSFIIDNISYVEVPAQNWLSVEAAGTNPVSRVYWREGTNVMCLPTQYSVTATVHTNYLPTRPDALSADSVSPDFPDGYEEIVCLEAAARLLLKGGMEPTAAALLRQEANLLRDDMLTDINRLSLRARTVAFSDFSSDYAG